ncbi:unnamed protein product [Penicillium salamii]|uniref:Steroid 5-alpha reductase C-terminal domain-containing protein n=1 Tax=Penicillium salamii TaxID=1612424 RepID=A0A9W4IRE6_9EURO|nr:unnamed protein product [Penicillium salamii]CAG8068076.1 unnamed protein product [Penicillium salamii]CAG8263610.1 unnamed protein product [Penicillium salamii]CAG8316509.1 unnamed protein product [Penicillium salamii]CAG8324095.1 unnamed protein product [Penicillium salamii]
MAFLIPPSTLESQPFSPLHSPPLQNRMTSGDVGILKSTLLPSFGIYASLSLGTYLAAEATDRVELKDWLWPSAQVLNAWWIAVGRPMHMHDLPFSTVWGAQSWTEKVLLSCVTIWGTRLFFRIAARSLTRGKDDSRYDAVKKEPGFWKRAFGTIFLPEALVLTIISLPFTAPLTIGNTTLALGEDALNAIRALGVGLFGIGFGLEVLADTQLELHRRERTHLCRHGVWSLVRHPNYLGDTLVHFSFTVLNMAGMWNPTVLLGPIMNYIFLRLVGGDKQTEASQLERYKSGDPLKYNQLVQWRKENNSFWPALRELASPWAFTVLGCGFISVVVEEGLRGSFEL